MRKKFLWGLLVLVSGALIWCLFLKPDDYQVTFKTKAIPGTINQAIKLWANDLDHSKLLQQTDSIAFNFCYPIIKSDTLPQINGVQYKQIQEQKAIKTVFNGNYIISDRAWYTMIAYAKKNGLAIRKQPIEVFYSNPNMGGDELNWKAEVFMPLKE